MTFAAGDGALMSSLAVYRYLTSGQLARRHGRSSQVIRRRFREFLRPEGYVVTLQRQPTEEAAYALGPKGFEYVAHELGCSVEEVRAPRNVATVRGFFWKHTVLVNDIRIAFDLATSDPTSPVAIYRTIAEWEVASGSDRKAPHYERFVLSERLRGDDGAWHYHRPDCLFLMYAKAAGTEQLVAVFLEADRNTEAMRRIRQKFEAYFLHWRARRHEVFDAVASRVLMVLDDVADRTRIRSMQDQLNELARRKGSDGEAFRRCFRFARKRDLDEKTVLAEAIWWDADDNARPFFQPVRTSQTSEAQEPERAHAEAVA